MPLFGKRSPHSCCVTTSCRLPWHSVRVPELATLAEQRTVLSAERASFAARATAAEVDRQKLLDLDQWRRRVAGNLDNLSYQERRMVLDALGVTVRLYGADRLPKRYDITLA